MKWSNLDDVAGGERFVLFNWFAVEDDRVLRPQREEVVTLFKMLDPRLDARHGRMIEEQFTLRQPADQQTLADDRGWIDQQIVTNNDVLVRQS